MHIDIGLKQMHKIWRFCGKTIEYIRYLVFVGLRG